MKERLKRLVGPEWQTRLHRLGRLRWLTKYRLMRGFGAHVSRRRQLAYVLLDPETESFSFDLDNEPELIAALATALGTPAEALARYADETRSDPELNANLTRHVRWQFDVKRRMPLGNRLAWYVIARATKPQLVVETGIYLGLGSLVLLRALARNREDGHPGELISFDTNPRAGSVVRDGARAGWQKIDGSTRDLLAPAIEGRAVDILFQDTPHTDENQRFEFGQALSHAAARLILVDGSGGTAPTLEAICAERHGVYHSAPLRSRDHIYPAEDIRFAIFERAPERQARASA